MTRCINIPLYLVYHENECALSSCRRALLPLGLPVRTAMADDLLPDGGPSVACTIFCAR
jgi:hypothetical protein